MADTSGLRNDPRPLSPHLQIYRWQITMLMSICHRITGIALAVGTLLLVWWLVALASGPAAYAQVQSVIGSPIGIAAMFAWSLALFYHLLNGIRHLFWDAGYGFELSTMTRSGYAVIVLSVVLTVAAWAIAGATAWVAMRGPA